MTKAYVETRYPDFGSGVIPAKKFSKERCQKLFENSFRGLKMHKKNDLIKELNQFKNQLSTYIPIKNMILFGSSAKGKMHRDGDIDLIVVSDKFKRKKSFKRSIGFYKYWDLDYPVDFLCYTPEEFNKLKKQITIVREAIREGIEI